MKTLTYQVQLYRDVREAAKIEVLVEVDDDQTEADADQINVAAMNAYEHRDNIPWEWLEDDAQVGESKKIP